jgi:hypothetical protein
MILYAVQPDGTLLWYEHSWNADGTPLWIGPRQVNNAFQKYRSVFAGENGTIYAVQPGGRLLWFGDAAT